jgi:hypothetical protein
MLKSEFGQWLKSVVKHWIALLGCAGIAAFQLVYSIWQQSSPPVITWLILFLCVFAAVFLAWRDEYRKAVALHE